MSEGGQVSNSLCPCCTCGCLAACNACLQKLCLCCCPHLKSKEQYAHIEYEPLPSLESGIIPTAVSSHKFSSASKKYSYLQGFDQPPLYPQVGNDFDVGVITHEPRSNEPWGQEDVFTPPFEPVPTKQLRKFPPLSETESIQGSLEDLGVEVGFVDYARSESVSSEQSVEDDRNIRICRTPERMLSIDLEQPDSSPAPLPMSGSRVFLPPPIRHRSLQITPQATPRKPSFHFSLYYDEKHQFLIVHLLRAFNLPTKRDESACNPFVELYLLPNKSTIEESCVLHQTLSPVFDQTFKFTKVTEESIRKQMLVLRIYINERQHFIGGVLFPLEGANLFGSANKVDIVAFDEEEGLKGTSEGDLLLSLTYHPEAGTLQIVIFEACNLKKQDLIGLTNPYVKVNTLHQGNRMSKWKTGIKKNTLAPVFNELCLLDISTLSIDDVQLEVIVMDYDRFGRNNQIGSVLFGPDVANEMASEHWNRAISNPNTSCMFWHAIGRPTTTAKLQPPSRSRSPSPRRSTCVQPTTSED